MRNHREQTLITHDPKPDTHSLCVCINSGFCWTRLHSRSPQTNITLYSGHVCLLEAQNDSQTCSVSVLVLEVYFWVLFFFCFFFWSLHCCNISVFHAVCSLLFCFFTSLSFLTHGSPRNTNIFSLTSFSHDSSRGCALIFLIFSTGRTAERALSHVLSTAGAFEKGTFAVGVFFGHSGTRGAILRSSPPVICWMVLMITQRRTRTFSNKKYSVHYVKLRT